jgi:WhiB family redox-sensing transcriptional regulator
MANAADLPCHADPDALFVQGRRQHQAKKVCCGCLMRVACLAEALERKIDHGVWGGMTVRERRALRRKHQPASWQAWLEEHGASQAASTSLASAA